MANQAVGISRKYLSLLRDQVLLNAIAADRQANFVNIQRLIQLSIKRIENELPLGYSFRRQSRLNELKILSDIKFDGSVESMSRLIAASEEVSFRTSYEMRQCIKIFHRIKISQPDIILKLSIARLLAAANSIEKRNPKFHADSAIAKKLAIDLNLKLESFAKKEINYQTFKTDCFKLIDEARPTLEKHRGYKRILANITLAILGVGVLYLIAAGINVAVRGQFLFFSDAKSSRIAKDIKTEVIHSPKKF